MTDAPSRNWHKSIRLHDFDYSSAFMYFVTQCAADRKLLFGDVVNTEMPLTPFGEIAQQEWTRTIELRKELIPHAFVVMPNHIHLLFSFDANLVKQTPVASHGKATRLSRQPRSVGSLMAGYKGAVTRAIRKLVGDPLFEVWQEGFHEHIVRNHRSFDVIHGYILDNPRRWAEDRENPANWGRS